MDMTGYNYVLGGARRWDFLASLVGPEAATFVEVGCKEGRTTAKVLEACPKATVIAIDPWRAMPEMADVEKGETYVKWDFAEIERLFWENVGAHKDRCRMLKMTSLEAAEEVGPGLDVVFIDAAHNYKSVCEDIRTWWPLIKDGGILAGHDFNHNWVTIERAVADCFPLMQVGVGPDSVWFVLKQEGTELRG